MSGRIEAVQVRTLRAIDPIVSRPIVAHYVKALIQYEAYWRRLAAAELKVVGIRTTNMRRAKVERATSPARLAQISGKRPAVNWHEGGSGPALLLINGWTASGLVWPEAWVEKLEQHYRVIRIDNRGTGFSRTAPAPFTITTMANDAADVLKACGIESATVLGLSMGGMISQELAMRHPSLVNRLILVATAPPLPAQLSSDPAPFLSALRGPAKGQSIDEFFGEIWGAYMAPSFTAEHPEVVAEIVEQVKARVTPKSKVIAQMRAIRSWSGSGRLRRLSMPTTVVHGTTDPLIPVGNGMRLARLIPDATYVELPGVGHLIPHEAGEELLTILAG